MARLSRIQERVHAQVGRLAQGSLLPEALGRRLLDALGQAIPADVQSLFGVDPASLLFNRLLAVNSGESMAGTMHWLERVYLAGEPSPHGTFPAFMRGSYSVVAIHERVDRSWGMPHSAIGNLTDREFTRVFHEIGTPSGGILRGCFAVDGRWVAALEFGRFDAGTGFRPTEVAFLRLLAPTIGRALACAFRREEAASAGGFSPDASGVVLLAPDGRVQLCTLAAEAWFGVLRDSVEPAAPGVSGLPVAVHAAVARHRAGRDNGAPGRVLVSTPAGPLRVEASRGGADDDSIAVVLSAEPRPAMPVAPAWWPLTAQERATVTLVVHGLRNRQIAERLAVTENTVQTHLAHAYDKLGVNGRGQLLARLFRDGYWPGFPLPEQEGDEQPYWFDASG